MWQCTTSASTFVAAIATLRANAPNTGVSVFGAVNPLSSRPYPRTVRLPSSTT